MGSICCLLFYVLLVLKSAPSSRAREIARGHWNDVNYKEVLYDVQHHVMDDDQKGMHEKHVDDEKIARKHVQVHDDPSSHMDHMDQELNVFFTVNDLKVGKKMPIYFPIKGSPHLLPKEEADSIPFSLPQLPHLLEFFSFSQDSPQAKAMEDTIRHCELEPIKGETKFCSTSLESMLDSTRGIFGLDTQFQVITTTHLKKPIALLQNYTILGVPKEKCAPKMVACHTMPYPYTVFYCHSQESDNKVLEVSLGSENGERLVEAVAVCHMDTSQWDPDHVSFRVLRIHPGTSPVCHFFPADNLIWVPSSTLN